MIEKKTELKLTKTQLEVAITDHLLQENGLHEVFSMTINGLMQAERQQFLRDKTGNKANGYRTVSKAGLGSELQLRIPRDRMGVFKPVIYGLIQSQQDQIEELSYTLYGKGLTTRQIGEVIEKMYGKNYSKSTVSAITNKYAQLVESWRNRPLDANYLAIYIDALQVKVRRDTVQNEAYYTLLGVKQDFTREVLSVINLPEESATGWNQVLQSIKQRGVKQVGLFVFDGLAGLGQAVASQFKTGLQQLCTLHHQKNLSRLVRKSDREVFCAEMKEVFNPDTDRTTGQAVTDYKLFLNRWKPKYKHLNHHLKEEDKSKYFTYFNFDRSVRRMIYTTNWIERLNKSYRRTLKIRNALPNAEAAITLIGYVAMEMQQKTYSYPITAFKNDKLFLTWSSNQ